RTIDVHEVWHPGGGVNFVLDHGDTLPCEPVEQLAGLRHDRWIGSDRLAVDAHAAGWRGFSDAAVATNGNRGSVPHEEEDADSRPNDSLLYENWIGGWRVLTQALP